MELGERLKLHIESTTGTGDGIAHADGFVIFVRGAVRGDLCLAEIDRVSRRAAFCHISALLQPSPLRIPSDCAIHDRCGGCPARCMTYADELSAKAGHVRACLRRLGGWDAEPDQILGAPSRDGYRNKAVLRFSAPDGDFGFCEEGTHTPVPGNCRALADAEAAEAAKAAVAAWCRRTGYAPWGLLIRQSVCFPDMLVGILADCAPPDTDDFCRTLRAAVPRLSGIVHCPPPGKGGTGLGRDAHLLWGSEFIREELCGLPFSLSPAAFFQVNTQMAEKLYSTAAEYITAAAPRRVLDLYCGIGSIGLCTTSPETPLIGVEIVPTAVECARRNAEQFGRRAEFIAGDAFSAAKKLAARGERPDLVILDPPRKGLSSELCELLCRMSPAHIVYISCDPATLARDISRLAPAYRPERYSIVDLFPGTNHVESVVLLSREKVDDYVRISVHTKDLKERMN